MKTRSIRILGVAAALALPWLAGCGKGGGGGGGPPPGMKMNVRAEAAKVEPVAERVALVASIAANEMVEIFSEIDGRVDVIGFTEGATVRKGQILVELDTAKLDASVREAEARFRLSEADRSRVQSLLDNKTVSQQEYDQAIASYDADKASLERIRQERKDARLLAPFDGIVGARHVSPGQVISKSTRITTLVDPAPAKIEFTAPERFVGQLATGQSVELTLAAYPGETFRGTVYFIDPKVDPDTRTVLVKAEAPNDDFRLRPGMFGNLNLVLTVREAAVTVPESAVLRDGNATFLYTIDADGAAQMVPVTLGTRLEGRVEITSGLTGGEMVIFEGTQKIGPGAPVLNTLAESPAAATPDESAEPAP